MLILSAALPLFLLPWSAVAVKKEDFKTCSQSAFCRRLRSLAPRAASSPSWASPYQILSPGAIETVEDASTIRFPVGSSLYPEAKFELRVDVVGDGIARVRMDEILGLRQRYNEASRWTLVERALSRTDFDLKTDDISSSITYASKEDALELRIRHAPLLVELYRNGADVPDVVLNGRGLLHMEHFRLKASADSESKTNEIEAEKYEADEAQSVVTSPVNRTWFEGEASEWEKDLWEERFKTWTDSKPKGPESYSLDISFPSADRVYGIPEHASPLALPSTDGSYYSDPYRLFNVDIFEYEADSAMSLYGAIPFLQSHSSSSSVGVFVLTSAETWVDVNPSVNSTGYETQWLSESGVLDVFLLPGSTSSPLPLYAQYASLVGPSALPAHWALGYHQCRWNYNDEEDVLTVDAKFDSDGEGFPLDVTWLDIEYAEEHRYFDWNHEMFPDVKRMLKKIEDKGRKMVAIVDPHIKRQETFPIYAEAVQLDILVKQPDAVTDFEGWCWTGSSAYVDFFLEKSWDWWQGLFKFDKWTDSAKNLFIWNDMNEPAVFNGPEITMQKDNTHQNGKWEHRDIHNANGLMFHKQTALGLLVREEPAKRPFVLSRSFFAGSQRWGAIWTGDNMGTWEHLAGSFPMLLSLGISGMSFSGADVGGFFGNPAPEYLTRWYQAGVFMPFFRAHAHIDTKRREPFLLAEPYKSHVREMLRLRYSMLPVWYTAFREAAVDGAPVLRPQFVQFPKDKAGYELDDQFYVGRSGLLVKPIVEEESYHTTVYLSDNQPYYDYFSHVLHPALDTPRNISVSAPIDTVPVFHQGSSILPLRTRIRRSSPLMWQDPYTLVVALGRDFSAEGELYSDDGDSFAFESGEFVWREFSFRSANGVKGSLKSESLVKIRPGKSGLSTEKEQAYEAQGNAWAKKIENVRVERIVVLGLKAAPKRVSVAGSGETVEFEWSKGIDAKGKKGGQASKLVLKNPAGALIVKDWELVFE